MPDGRRARRVVLDIELWWSVTVRPHRPERNSHDEKTHCRGRVDAVARPARGLRRAGYFNVKSTLDVCVKVNAVQVPKGFYDDTDGWHITYGDSDQDH